MLYDERKTWKVGTKDMKPRIFVSSTFYDLKYIREDLSNFIKAHDFEPVMFEDGDIGYTPGQPLDMSCYETMRSADMVLLIIGGNYGSPATGEVKDEFKEYISVTRNEFKSAVNEGVPLYVFIDDKVYVEYGVYEENCEEIESGKLKIHFKNVKDINVFRFIKEIKNVGNISITEFNKILQIKDFLSKQWSDMFKNYLNILKTEKADKKFVGTMDDMKILIRKMDVMLDTVGKKILTADDSKEYESVIERQKILSLCDDLVNSLEISEEDYIEETSERTSYIEKLVNALHDSVNTDVWEKYKSDEKDIYYDFYKYFDNKEIDLNCSVVELGDRIKKNIDIFENSKLKKILINEILNEKNYKKLFAEIK